jgi:hypothetical protein
MQAHNDIVVYDDAEQHELMDAKHEDLHHQNDSNEDEHKKHHHHCSVVNLSLEFIPAWFDFEVLPVVGVVQKPPVSYQQTFLSNYLVDIFQPPRV